MNKKINNKSIGMIYDLSSVAISLLLSIGVCDLGASPLRYLRAYIITNHFNFLLILIKLYIIYIV